MRPSSPAPAADLRGKFDCSVSLLCWGYNEEELIEGFFDKAFGLLDAVASDFEIVFVDDGSTDSTGALADAYARKEPRLRVLHNGTNRNVGYSCSRAIGAAQKEFLFWQTVDWSYDLTHLRIFLELLKHYDVVQGIRPTPIRLLSHIPILKSIYRVNSRSDSLAKGLVSLGNYYLLRLLFGLDFHDFQNITFYPTPLIQSVRLKGDSSFINPECLFRAYERGARFIEVPIGFLPRAAGRAKGTRLTSIVRSVRDILSAWVAWGLRFRSLHGRGAANRRIHRVAEPFWLDEPVLELVIPLFKEYRPRGIS